MLPYSGRHFDGLRVSLFANASDYSNKTCVYRSMCLYLTKYASLVGVVTCVGDGRYDYISDPQNGGHQTEVYKSVRSATSHACYVHTCYL